MHHALANLSRAFFAAFFTELQARADVNSEKKIIVWLSFYSRRQNLRILNFDRASLKTGRDILKNLLNILKISRCIA